MDSIEVFQEPATVIVGRPQIEKDESNDTPLQQVPGAWPSSASGPPAPIRRGIVSAVGVGGPGPLRLLDHAGTCAISSAESSSVPAPH